MAGTKQKRGQAGSAAQYLTRNQALKKLQLKLPEFRRLCILKGIHPREPKKKVHGPNKTYYHVKDVNFLLHEPLLDKFRDAHAYERKIRRAKAKRNRELLLKLIQRRPTFRLDHLVRERYPSFVDALRDIDDALTLVFLFATLPADKHHKLPQKVIEQSRRVALEWQAWVVRSHALRKVFVTVRGYYFQAEVMGQAITWMTPHQVSQVLPVDVDYRVMLTFLDFYLVLLRFVNFKLYHALGLKYPPGLHPELEAAAAGLEAVMHSLAEGSSGAAEQTIAAATANMQGGAAEVEKEMIVQESRNDASDEDEDDDGNDDDEEEDEEEEEDDDDDDGDLAEDDEEGTEPVQTTYTAEDIEPADSKDVEEPAVVGGAKDCVDDAEICEKLFHGMTFFLGREVPREPLMLVIRAFGGVCAWAGEGSPVAESDESVTHQVVDRPTQGHRFLSREYVQPQWVFDSANFRVLAPCEKYAPGVPLPPHLSPFAREDDYEPEWQTSLKELQAIANEARRAQAGQQTEARFASLEAAGEMQPELPGGEGERAAHDGARAAEAQYQAELAKELRLAGVGEAKDEEKEKEKATISSEHGKGTAIDEQRMKTTMMSKKAKRLYESIHMGRARKSAELEKLTARREALKAKRQKTTKGHREE